MSATALLTTELRSIPQFADLSEEALEWLASHMKLVELEAGQQFFAAGAPADRMIVILEVFRGFVMMPRCLIGKCIVRSLTSSSGALTRGPRSRSG